MKINQFLMLILATLLTMSCTHFIFAESVENPKSLAIQAVSDNPKEAAFAIRELRNLGGYGLTSLFETYRVDIEDFKKTGEATEKWQRIAKALDSVAMQKDVYASELFWFTDLEKAKAEAARTNKPILSLRLLGNLNEEFSCANSRFFRAILYPNSQISKFLRENYILHWKSVRPAPKITIDFGDGRKIERTITGNSIHYVLDKNGTVIDALSGLNSPQLFLEFLQNGNEFNKHLNILSVATIDGPGFVSPLTTFRANKYRELTAQMNRFSEKLNLKFDTTQKAARNFEGMPPAVLAMTIAVTKKVVEMPVLKDITSDMTKYGEEQINLENWKQIAKLSGREAKLDENTIAFIRRQTAKNNLSEAEFKSLISKLEEYVSVDTARNEFLLRPTLLVWLTKGEGTDLAKMNEKVYSELFLTPSADKWLGLYAPDVYTALDGNGIK